MTFLLGTDEAGYGPNLGPLVVTATAWQVDDGPADADLYSRLAAVVTEEPPKRGDDRLHLADSKSVYSPQAGLSALERGVLAILGAIDSLPDDWNSLWQMLSPAALDEFSASDCYRAFACRLPLQANGEEVRAAGRRLADGCKSAGVRLLAVRSRAVFPAEFNALTEAHGNKAGALSAVTLLLAAELLRSLPDGPALLICDKHGGRNSYAPLLQQHLTEDWVESLREGRDESHYRFGPAERPVEARFCCRAERFLPVAVASMVSKYLRELSMRAFNAFWQRHVPMLRPTAGYPVDARRFKQDIAAAQAALAIDDRDLWRMR